MIKKDLDPFDGVDKFAIAGRNAEDKMAFYLKRYFGNSPNIFVLNNIRVELKDDAAQIDHLIIHPYGMTIIESKSVHGKVQIKEDGQWVRWYGNESKGMASPITQARLQALFLKDYLNLHAKPKDYFNIIPIDVKVAISDNGLILWSKDGKLLEVSKADQVADSIVAFFDNASTFKHKELLNLNQIEKLCDFLCKSHKPYVRKAKEGHIDKIEVITESNLPQSDPVATENKPQCAHCKSLKLEIVFGHTYYFHCLECDKNTSIKSTCSTCKTLFKLRKTKKEFFNDCGNCKISSLFYVNA